ncbi:MAG: hypothetical protein M5R37_09380 [Melioribacteraceae bacterium]|nr:hypothetical protein [Melioribacteraceae bacterium]
MSDEWDKIYDAFNSANEVKMSNLTGRKIIRAVKERNVDEVKKLLNLSLDDGGPLLFRLTVQDEEGKTALEIAKEEGYTEIITLLNFNEKN